MKKYVLMIIVGLLIGGTFFYFYSDHAKLTQKRAAFTETSKQYDKNISNLFIIKDAPIKYKQNDFKLTVFSPDTLHFEEKYVFEQSSMAYFGMGGFIYYGDINGLTDTEEESLIQNQFEKVLFKDVDAYYKSHEVYNEQLNNYYVSEELYFLKDKVKYLISWGYIYDGKKKMDFLKFLDENLVRVIE